MPATTAEGTAGAAAISIFLKKYGDCTIKDFIRMFKSNLESIKNNCMHELVSGYMWRLHFFPQVFWINREFFENSIIIKYTDDLDEKIHDLLKYLKIDDKGIPLEKSNVTFAFLLNRLIIIIIRLA